jgi:hypothetical protein
MSAVRSPEPIFFEILRKKLQRWRRWGRPIFWGEKIFQNLGERNYQDGFEQFFKIFNEKLLRCRWWGNDIPLRGNNQGILKGEVSLYIDLLFDWFGISCITTDYFCFYLQNSQMGGLWYSDTPPLIFPEIIYIKMMKKVVKNDHI